MEKVLITGTSCGIGREIAIKFLEKGFTVYGIDIKDSSINHYNYYHFNADVREADKLPDLQNVSYIINNAGIITPQADAISVNLVGYINVIEKYGYDRSLKSIVNIGGTSSIKGYDNIRYCCSQGGRDALTKWCANMFGNDSRHVLCNSVNVDGIEPNNNLETELNSDDLIDSIKELNVLKKLPTAKDVAEWVYFMSVENQVMTGQIISIDGELTGAYKYIPYNGWND